jgi:hypothetical protein
MWTNQWYFGLAILIAFVSYEICVTIDINLMLITMAEMAHQLALKFKPEETDKP